MATDAQGRLLSDDGNYYWDGTNWQAVDASGNGPATTSSQSPQVSPRTDAQGRQLSDDGNYYWDGSNWQSADTSGGGGSSAGGDSSGGGSSGGSGSSAGGDASQQSGQTDSQGRQLSEDGNYYWDGSDWQLVDAGSAAGAGQAAGSASSSSYDPLDGGLPPGGLGDDGMLPAGQAQEREQCDKGPCPTCASEQSMSSPCTHQIYHQGDHECANGHSWSSGSQRICGASCPKNDGKTCELEDIHKDAAIPHEHYVAGDDNHKWKV